MTLGIKSHFGEWKIYYSDHGNMTSNSCRSFRNYGNNMTILVLEVSMFAFLANFYILTSGWVKPPKMKCAELLEQEYFIQGWMIFLTPSQQCERTVVIMATRNLKDK